jgi:hypothetical protein
MVSVVGVFENEAISLLVKEARSGHRADFPPFSRNA